MDKNSLANAGDMGFDPWSGKIPHTPEQLSTPLPQLVSLVLQPLDSHTCSLCSAKEKPSGVNEKPKHHSEEQCTLTPTRERPHKAMKTQRN